jgi:hypothetical protein
MARKIKTTKVYPVKKGDAKPVNHLKGIVKKLNGLRKNISSK